MNTKAIILSLCLATGLPVFGQGLHKEINVDQEIVPVKRDAARITILPTLQLPAISRPQLSFSNRVVTTRVPNAISTLEPVAYGENLFSSPYRGYVALGLGAPLYNGALSAGYRILDTDHTRLSAWGQYDGDIYTHKVDGEKLYLRDHTASIGLDLSQTIGKKSSLKAGLDYSYGYHSIPSDWQPFTQSTNRINLTALFQSKTQSLDWNAGIRYRHFGFFNVGLPQMYSFIDNGTGSFESAHKLDMGKPVNQNLFGINFDGSLDFDESSSIGLDINADFLSTSTHQTPVYPFNSIDDRTGAGSKTAGLISITPHYDYFTQSLKAGVGAQIDLSINNGRVIHIAPEASIAWTPSQIVGFEIKAHGGSDMNSLSGLYDITPYLNSSMAYGQSHIPYAIDGRVTAGPFFGAHIEFFGGYAKANDWLMPTSADSYLGGAVFERVDLSAWHAGAALGYDYRNTISARVSYETAPHDYEHSFYEWRDRARHVVNAELKVRPFAPLQLTAGWEFRAGRRSYMMVDDLNASDIQSYSPHAKSLGCISNLSVGASYAVCDPLTVFARGENLLGRHYYHIGDRYSRGANFLIGASLKF